MSETTLRTRSMTFWKSTRVSTSPAAAITPDGDRENAKVMAEANALIDDAIVRLRRRRSGADEQHGEQAGCDQQGDCTQP